MVNKFKDFWENYYKTHKNPDNESPFARFVLPFLKENSFLYELGCGNGRDCIFLNKTGINIIAFDQCENEINYLNDKYQSPTLKFEKGDFTNLGELPQVDYIYSRFTLHSVTKEQEIKTLKWAFSTLKNNGLFFIEIRSIHDDLFGKGEPLPDNAFITDHYRRFVRLEDFINRIKDAGFSILYKIQAKGLAPYKNEDPVVIRVIAQKIV